MNLKVPVVYLNVQLDFEAWHVALRRLVKGRMMGDALLYSVPENQMQAMTKRMKETAVQVQKIAAVKREQEEKSALGHAVAPDVEYMKIDLTVAAPLVAEPRPEKEALIMKSMGVTPATEEFFSSTVCFVNFRTEKKETEKENFFRVEIWQWIETSLSKGVFKWVARTIQPVYDIHAIYTRVVSLANKATWISHCLEFQKIFTMKP